MLGSLNVFAVKEDYPLNWKYRGGNNLIYDCINKYYVCASDVARISCEEDRTHAIDTKLDKYSCAVLKRFTNKEECLQKQHEVLNTNVVRKFCFSDRFHH